MLGCFPTAIHECCGSTEVCTHNSQEPGGHCSHCTFQLGSERKECASPHQQSGVRASRQRTHAYPYTGYYFAVVFFLLREVLLVSGFSVLEYYFYFITSGSPSANKQGISSSSRQTPWLRISELKAGSKNQLEQCLH